MPPLYPAPFSTADLGGENEGTVQIADADKSPTKRPTPRFIPGVGVVVNTSRKAAHGATQAATVLDLVPAPMQERKGRKERTL